VGHIIGLAGLAPHRRSRLTSNVRQTQSPGREVAESSGRGSAPTSSPLSPRWRPSMQGAGCHARPLADAQTRSAATLLSPGTDQRSGTRARMATLSPCLLRGSAVNTNGRAAATISAPAGVNQTQAEPVRRRRTLQAGRPRRTSGKSWSRPGSGRPSPQGAERHAEPSGRAPQRRGTATVLARAWSGSRLARTQEQPHRCRANSAA